MHQSCAVHGNCTCGHATEVEARPFTNTDLVRKEVRVRPDQAAALLTLRKKVADQRTEKKGPITDNVLIRLAVDLLLVHADRLQGNAEDDLRASLLGES